MCPKEFTSRSVTVRVFIFIFIMTLFSFQDCQQRCSLLSYQLMIRGTAEIFGDIWRGQIEQKSILRRKNGKLFEEANKKIKLCDEMTARLFSANNPGPTNICSLKLASVWLYVNVPKSAGPVRCQNLFSSKPLYFWTINRKSSFAINEKWDSFMKSSLDARFW